MNTKGDETNFTQKYLSEIKAAWALSSKGNPWWMKCQCGPNHIAVFDPSYDAAYCTNCLAWLSGKCSDQNCDYCANRPDIYNEFQTMKRTSWQKENGNRIDEYLN